MSKEHAKISEEELLTRKAVQLPFIPRENCGPKVKEIDLNKSPGPYDPPMKIVKRFEEQLSLPLTSIINSSFQEKCFGEL